MPSDTKKVKPEPDSAEAPKHRVMIWDLPTRLFHWLLVLLVLMSFITGKLGGTAMQYHEWSGAAILVLLLFRLLWGFCGGSFARFGSFVRGPRTVIGYVRSVVGAKHETYLGHNPLGGWSIIAMLVILLVQAGTGLFANDDILAEGPLFQWVSKETSDWLTRIHHGNQGILAALIGVHLFAVIFYLVGRGENLIKPMLTGYKHWQEPVNASAGSPILASIITALLAGAVYLFLYY